MNAEYMEHYKRRTGSKENHLVVKRKKRSAENFRKYLKHEKKKKFNYLKTTQWMFDLKNKAESHDYISAFL